MIVITEYNAETKTFFCYRIRHMDSRVLNNLYHRQNYRIVETKELDSECDLTKWADGYRGVVVFSREKE